MRNEIDPKYDFEVKLDFSDYGGGGRKDWENTKINGSSRIIIRNPAH